MNSYHPNNPEKTIKYYNVKVSSDKEPVFGRQVADQFSLSEALSTCDSNISQADMKLFEAG